VSASRLVVVSNRLPSLEDSRRAAGAKDRPTAQPSVGGLVSAMLPALTAAPGSLWLGWSGRSVAATERPRTTRARHGGVQLIGLDLRAEDVEAHYNGFCNGVLWPLLHSFPGRLIVDAEQYRRFRHVNRTFARALSSRLRPEDRVWVHDYHLIPLAAELRARGFTGRIGFFLHVPFCGHDVFSLVPWAGELLQQLLRYDVVGFHTPDYARNYVDAVSRELNIDADALQHVGAYPIGIDPAPLRAWSEEASALTRGRALREAVQGRRVILGVDRLDYTKGIPERLRAFERLLERRPAWRRNVSYVQVSAPSRTKVPEYVRQRREVEELVGRINGRFGEPDWVPVRYLFRAYSQRELAAYYRESDVCLVSPLRDGMNLVAKEFVTCQADDPGVLVLSRFAGAAAELKDALVVNPYDLDGMADALARALSMPLDERQARQRACWRLVKRDTATRWAARFVDDLSLTATAEPGGPADLADVAVAAG
jgi:alpha,alpha-trehalose-phosphate synthase [UDP-forming]